MVEKIRLAFDGDLAGKTVAVLGLSFKPDTDDIRESPATEIVKGLLEAGASVRAFDPAAMEAFREDWPQIEYCENSHDAAAGADAVVIATEWNQFKALELKRLKELLKRPLIIDLRNIYEPSKIEAAGFDYISVGRAEVAQGQTVKA